MTQGEWIQLVRVYPPYQGFSQRVRERLAAMLWKLMVHAVWETKETWPGWDELMKVTGWGRSSVADYLRQLQIDGWLLLVESGSTPAHRPMATQGLISGNRRAVYQLRVPAARGEARRRAAAEHRQGLLDATRVVAEAEAILASAAARIAAENASSSPLGGLGDVGRAVPAEHAQALLDGLLLPSGSPQVSGVEGKNWTPAFAFQVFTLSEMVVLSRVRRVVHNSQVECGSGGGGQAATSSGPGSSSAVTEVTESDEALRARFDEKQGGSTEVESPTSGFGMLVAAAELIAAVPALAGLGRSRLRSLLEPYWARGGTTSEALAALRTDWQDRTPVTEPEQLAAALRLQADDPVLARVAVRRLIRIAGPYWQAGWTCADLVHALRWYPATWTTRPGQLDDRVRFPSRWVAARLTAWHDEHGRILPGHSATSAVEQRRRDRLRERHGVQGALAAPAGAAELTVTDVRRRAATIADQVRRLLRGTLRTDRPDATTGAAAESGGEAPDQTAAPGSDERRGGMPSWLRDQLDRRRAKTRTATPAAPAAAPTASPTNPARRWWAPTEPQVPDGPLTREQAVELARQRALYERSVRR